MINGNINVGHNLNYKLYHISSWHNNISCWQIFHNKNVAQSIAKAIDIPTQETNNSFSSFDESFNNRIDNIVYVFHIS